LGIEKASWVEDMVWSRRELMEPLLSPPKNLVSVLKKLAIALVAVNAYERKDANEFIDNGAQVV
jgi:hypothetical protein